MQPISDTLSGYVAYIQSKNPPALQAWAADTESDFYAAIERALEVAIHEIESGARQLTDANEQLLSWMLVRLLRAASIGATAEGYHNGHVDVTIEHPRHPFTLLGECKIHDGYQRHHDGCSQLLVRYSSGRSSRTFCMDFFHSPRMYEKLARLRAEFDARRPLQQIEDAGDHSIRGAFVTAHGHVTGARVEILHLGCNVFHPEAPGFPT